jgi:hypothetical protein
MIMGKEVDRFNLLGCLSLCNALQLEQIAWAGG